MNTRKKHEPVAGEPVSVIRRFLRDHRIGEVEAVVPDMAGVARGKLVPAEKYVEEEGMRLPESIFLQTVTGEYPADDSAIDPPRLISSSRRIRAPSGWSRGLRSPRRR